MECPEQLGLAEKTLADIRDLTTDQVILNAVQDYFLGPLPVVHSMMPNLTALIQFADDADGGRYARAEDVREVTALKPRIDFDMINYAGDYPDSVQVESGGGGVLDLPLGDFTILCDGAPLTVVSVTATGTKRAGFNWNFDGGVPDGEHWLRVEREGFSCVPFPFFMNRTGGPFVGQKKIPTVIGEYDYARGVGNPVFWADLPKRFTPTPRPLAPRLAPHFSDAKPRSQLFRTNVAPIRGGDVYRPNVTKNGIWSCFNKQGYYYSSVTGRIPVTPFLDGPRGVGCVSGPTDGLVDRHGGLIYSDSHGVRRIDTAGTIKTLAGLRHKHPPSHWNGPQDVEMVGDWKDDEGFWELWSIRFLESTLVTDSSLPLIGGEHPHPGDVIAFMADTQKNRIVRGSASGNDRSKPWVLETWIAGLMDPFDCIPVGDLLFISERTGHRITVYSAHTGQYLHTLLQGAALARVDKASRFVQRLTTIEAIRAEPVVAPEGMDFQDGWLYFTSTAMKQIRRIHIGMDGRSGTGELQVVVPEAGGTKYYNKVKVGDGTFGPRGTMFLVSWDNQNFGFPRVYLPDGTRWAINTYGPLPCGRGGVWSSLSYAQMAVPGKGTLYLASVAEGLVKITLALPTDPVITAAQRDSYLRGAKMFRDMGGELVYGEGAFGHFGFPRPFGKSLDLDCYLSLND